MTTFSEVAQRWTQTLQDHCGSYSETVRSSILHWLLGEEETRFDQLDNNQLTIAEQAMQYRLNILKQRYLGVSQERAYRNLIQRLSNHVVIRNKVRTWIALSRDRQQTVLDVIQEVVQEMLNSDRYIQQQLQWIAQCTTDKRLRNALVLASIEEYCLRPIRNQPLVVFRFVNYLRRSQRGGMTQVPVDEFIRLISEEISNDDSDSSTGSLLDSQALRHFEETQEWEDQQLMREIVKREFREYLAQQVDELTVQWLDLYLKGYPQDKIAQTLKIPIKQIYRLREKVSYHAIRVFSTKHSPEMVGNWLGTSLREHSLGLTAPQWDLLVEQLTDKQKTILEQLKSGKDPAEVASLLSMKPEQVLTEWSSVYLSAQAIRSND